MRKANGKSAKPPQGVPARSVEPVLTHASRPPPEGRAVHRSEPGPGLYADGSGCRTDPDRRPAGWKFRDERRTALVIATGPSSEPYGPGGWPDWPALVINDGWTRHAGAAAVYAADRQWWRCRPHPAGPSNLERVEREFPGERWTCSHFAAQDRPPGLHAVDIRIAEGLGRTPGPIYSGGLVGNSGAQGINLVYRWGARRIILVGFDMCAHKGREHRFGNHPRGLANGSNYRAFVAGMGPMAAELHKDGIEVINTCTWSALPYWPKIPLERL